MPTTRARAVVSVRKDIESSYQIVRSAVEELAASGGFSLDALNTRLKGAATDTVNTAFRARMEALRKAQQVGNMLIYDKRAQRAGAVCGASYSFRIHYGLLVGEICAVSYERRARRRPQ